MSAKRQFSGVASGAFFVFGFTSVIMGSALPAIEASLAIDHYLAGILLSVPTLGFAFGAFLVPFFSARLGPLKTLSGGLLAFTIAVTGIVLSRSYIPLLIFSVGMSYSTGTIETSIGVGVSSMRYEKPARTLNLMHSLFALGAIISPFVVSFFLPETSDSMELNFISNWWKPFLIAMIGAIGILFYSAKLLSLKFEHTERETHGARRAVLKNRIFWLIIVGIFLYVGYEVGLTSWISSYVFESKSIPLKYASIFPALLWIGLLFGRLVNGVVVERLGYELSLMAMAVISVIGFTMIIVLSDPILMAVAVFMAGLGFSGTYPTLQAVLISTVKNGVSFALAMFTIASSLGAAGTNYLVGIVGNRFGMSYGIFLVFGMILGELAIISLLMRVKRHDRS